MAPLRRGKRRRLDSPCPSPQEDGLSQDFEELAKKYTEFGKEWNLIKQSRRRQQQSLSTKSTPAFRLALTRALLDHHFGISLPCMPLWHLCPPVPNRWLYCQWVQQELMPLLSDAAHFVQDDGCHHSPCGHGIDLGTGASAIYPLLLTHTDPSLRMEASEIDAHAVDCAHQNIQANPSLANRIRIHLVEPTTQQQQQKQQQLEKKNGSLSLEEEQKGPLMVVPWTQDRYDFCVTNPPFFDETPPDRADGRERTPMTDTEGLYPGGETGWILDLLRDSRRQQVRVGWYTSMVAKKTSFQRLSRLLRQAVGPGRVRTHTLPVGQTTRWFLAWTHAATPSPTSPGKEP